MVKLTELPLLLPNSSFSPLALLPATPLLSKAGTPFRAVRPLKWHASWVQNVVRQFGLYLSWAYEICVALTLVREDRVGLTAGLPVVPPGALLGI